MKYQYKVEAQYQVEKDGTKMRIPHIYEVWYEDIGEGDFVEIWKSRGLPDFRSMAAEENAANQLAAMKEIHGDDLVFVREEVIERTYKLF